jgi:hypothetical protein
MRLLLAAAVVSAALVVPARARAAGPSIEELGEYGWVELDARGRKLHRTGGVLLVLGAIVTIPGTGLVAAGYSPASGDEVWVAPYVISGFVLVGVGGAMIVSGVALLLRGRVLRRRARLMRDELLTAGLSWSF